jgi:hypothetical protein
MLFSVHLVIGLILTQDRCTFWMHSMVLLGDSGHVESRFNLFGDSVSVGAR